MADTENSQDSSAPDPPPFSARAMILFSHLEEFLTLYPEGTSVREVFQDQRFRDYARSLFDKEVVECYSQESGVGEIPCPYQNCPFKNKS